MAISDAMRYRMNTGGSAEDLYATIRDFLATSPDAATTQAAMAQYGISGEDVANATGGKSGGLLGGNILAGASWNSLNTTLGDQLTEATGQATTNVAVGGATTADTLNQLNTYLAGGGQFDPNATVFLQTGGVDFIQGVDKGTIKDNINQIVKTLADQGVNVVLTGSPYAASINDVVTNNFDPKVDPLFTEIAKENKNVALVGTQGEILQNKKLLVDALHTNAEGTSLYNQSVIDSLSQFKNEVPSSTPQDIAKVQTSNVVATSTPIITQAAANPVVAQSLATQIQTPEVDYYAQQFAPDINQASVPTNTVTDYQGKTYDKTTLLNLAKELAPSIDANRLKGGVYSTTGQSIGFNYDEATNALGYAPSAAEQVVLDMARHLMDEGITSADQIQATDTNRRFGSTYTGEGGTVYEIKRDENGNLVTSTWGKTTSDKGNIIAAATIAAAFMGVPTDIGTAVLGQGASTAAINTVGGAIFGGGTAALRGGDIVKGALLGGAGGALGDYLNTASGAVLGDASDIAMTMADAGSSLAEIETALTNSGFSANVVAESLKDAANVLAPKAINIPSTVSGLTDAVNVVGQSVTPSLSSVLSTIAATAPVAVSTPVTDGGTVKVTAPSNVSLNNVLSTIASTIPDAGTVNVETPRQAEQRVIDLVNSQIASNVTTPSNLANVQVNAPKTTTTQDVINAIAATLPVGINTPVSTKTTPEIATQTITAKTPPKIGDALAAITTIPSTLTPTAVTPTSTTTTPTKETDPLKVAQLALAAAGLLGAGSALSSSGTPTGFDIVPIPETFLTPKAPTVAPFTPLPPINFGDRNLLIGTQWEKFLDPNYGKVPAPVQYSQPSSLSYNDLMGILGSRQGMPPASSLSINDIISGIQNQYGQAPARTMG